MVQLPYFVFTAFSIVMVPNIKRYTWIILNFLISIRVLLAANLRIRKKKNSMLLFKIVTFSEVLIRKTNFGEMLKT